MGSDAMIARAELALTQGRPQLALDLCQRMGADAMDNRVVLWLRLRALHDLDREEEVLELQSLVMRVCPTSEPHRLVLAAAATELGRFADAERHLIDLLRMDPLSSEAWWMYALTCARAGAFGKAQKLSEKAASLDPSPYLMALVDGWRLFLEGKDKLARVRVNEGLAIAPNDGAMWTLKAILDGEEGRFSDASSSLRQSVAHDGSMMDSHAQPLRELDILNHWTMAPLRWGHKVGPFGIWALAVGSLMVTRRVFDPTIALGLAVFWLVFMAYSWTWRSILTWWMGR